MIGGQPAVATRPTQAKPGTSALNAHPYRAAHQRAVKLV
jgi:hypothetical protein